MVAEKGLASETSIRATDSALIGDSIDSIDSSDSAMSYLRNHLTALKIVYITRQAALINLQRFYTEVSSEKEKQEPLWANMNVEEFGSSRERLTLIDVREPEELRYHGCFSGAINIPRVFQCLCVCVCVTLSTLCSG